MNLLERLKSEYRIELEDHIKMYPSSYGEVKENLENNEFVADLKYLTFQGLNEMNLDRVPSIYDMLK
jgi:hypothetical protein